MPARSRRDSGQGLVPAAVPPRRAYDSGARMAAAQRNRRLVLDVCRDLLLANGYRATTVRDVATAAGVSVEMIYKTFGGKPQLVKAVYDVAVADGDDLIPPADRPEIRLLESITEPVELIRAHAAVVTRIHGQLGGLLAVLAESGAEIEEISRTAESERRAVLGGIVDRLATMDFLDDTLSRTQAADAYWTVSAASLYVRLVHDRGWSPRQYTTWLTSMIIATLRPPRA
jgi:AcrR family transcriptional regulator